MTKHRRGHGRIHRMPALAQNGVLVTFSIFSHTQVTNYCSITQSQFNGPNMLRDQNGLVQQPVQ